MGNYKLRRSISVVSVCSLINFVAIRALNKPVVTTDPTSWSR